MILTALLTLSATHLAAEVMQNVSDRRIFFGHQSVGDDILAGVHELAGGKLSIREGRTAAAFASPGLVHTRIGKNEAPRTKLSDFEAALENLAAPVDIAFFKFCYVDFSASTDVEQLFTEYESTLRRLRAKHPGVTFVHVTVPLTAVPSGAKAWLRQTITRKPAWGARENETRHRFNTLLRTRLAGEPLFDLAALESTRVDGSSHTYQLEGQTLPALVAEYSDDGQHLNSLGRRRVAEALLTFLSRLP